MGLKNRKCKVKVFGIYFVGVGGKNRVSLIETVCLIETCAVRFRLVKLSVGLVLSRAKGMCDL